MLIYVKVSLWFAPMALYAVKTSRSNTYGDMSESMFQSLKHPEVGIPADKVESSCDALISFFWNISWERDKGTNVLPKARSTR